MSTTNEGTFICTPAKCQNTIHTPRKHSKYTSTPTKMKISSILIRPFCFIYYQNRPPLSVTYFRIKEKRTVAVWVFSEVLRRAELLHYFQHSLRGMCDILILKILMIQANLISFRSLVFFLW